MSKPTIVLWEDRMPYKFLPTISVGRGSAYEFDIIGAPEGLQELQVHVGDPLNVHTFTQVVGHSCPDNRWSVYANGLNFQHEGSAKYHITGKDAKGNSVWIGVGRVVVEESVIHIDAEDVPIVPEDCYIRNPSTGLWHKVTATLSDGEIVLVYDKEGVQR